jgi:hypothetical protein
MSIQLLRAGIVLKAMTIEARKGASFSWAYNNYSYNTLLDEEIMGKESGSKQGTFQGHYWGFFCEFCTNISCV